MNATEFASHLTKMGWTVLKRSEPSRKIPSVLQHRFEWIPTEYAEFLALFGLCIHPKEDSWFLGNTNFEDPSPFAFAWNEWEIQSMQAADTAGDREWLNSIKTFWDCHLPIAMSVRSGYAFLAVVVSGARKGQVVFGREPEFEDVTIVSGDLEEFFNKVVAHASNGAMNEYLEDFL